MKTESLPENAEPLSTSLAGGRSLFAMTTTATDRFLENRHYRSYRKQLQILIVEDQAFSQRLMTEILGNARIDGMPGVPILDVACSVREAWALYLRKAHHVVFMDLVLPDGSGHALARAIKEIDPGSCVIIVTANAYAEEMVTARHNDVDGFISKPYRKQQILDCIERYAQSLHLMPAEDAGYEASAG